MFRNKALEALEEYCAYNDVKLTINTPQNIVCEVDGHMFRWEWQDRAPDNYLFVIERLEDYFKNPNNYFT